MKSRESERERTPVTFTLSARERMDHIEGKNHGKEDGGNLTNTIFERSEKAAVIQPWWM